MVVGFTSEDGHGAVELLSEDQAYHLMGEGHLGEGYFLAGAVVDLGGETVRPTNDEDESALHRRHLLLNVSRKLHGGELLAVLIEQHHIVAFVESCEDVSAFGILLLCLGEILGVLGIGDVLDFERHIMLEP